jgi:RNA polymerase sigma-70 factor (ECF subfamily)
MRDEIQILGRARAGDIGAFNVLVERYQEPVYTLCYYMLGSADAAEEVTQVAFRSAYRGIGHYRGGSVVAWLLRVTYDECHSRAHGRRRASSLGGQESAQHIARRWGSEQIALPGERSVRPGLAYALQRRLQALPESQRLVVILRDVQGFALDQIAVVTGEPPDTVRLWLSRGRAGLRNTLRAELMEERVPAAC